MKYEAYDPTTDTSILNCRKEVQDAAIAMELKLQRNDHKDGWHKQPIEAHIRLLKIEMMELDVALEFLGDEEAAGECVDICNFAMIIRDKLLKRVEQKKLDAISRQNNPARNNLDDAPF